MGYELKTNTAVRIAVGPLVDPGDGKTAEVALTVTGMVVDIDQMDNDGTAVNRTSFSPTASGGNNDMVHITDDTIGMYDLELTAAQLNFLGNARISFYDVDGFLVHWIDIQVVSAAYFDFKYGSTAPSVNVSTITNDAITAASINTGAFTADAFAADAIVAATLATGALTADAFAADSIVAATLATGVLTADAFAANCIVAASIADNAIDAGSIATGAITNAKFAAGAIDAAAIADNAIDLATFAADAKTGSALKANVETITNGAITAAAIAANAIDDDAIAADVTAVIATAVWNAAAGSYGGAGTYGQAVEDILVDTGTTLDTLIKDIPTTSEFELRTLPAADYTVVSDLGTVQTGDSFAIVNGDHGLVSIQDDIDAILADTNELQTDWHDGGRLDLILDAASAPSAGDVADAVWDEALAGHSGAGSAGAALTAAGSAGDPWSTAIPGAYGAGTAGLLLGTTIPNAIDAIDNYVDTEITTLTNELAKVPKSDSNVTWNATALGSIQSECTDALNAYDPPTNAEMELRTLAAADYTIVSDLGTVQTGDSFAIVNGDHGLVSIQDDIDAILADTNELQVDDTPTAVAAVKTVVDAIKVKTDSLTFTKALEVDANMKSINGTTVAGDGGATPWGP